MTSPWFQQLAEGVASNLIAEVLIALALVALGQVAVFAGRWPLKTRLGIGLVAIGTIASAALWFGLPSIVSLLGFLGLSLAFMFYVLKDISHVGIVNAFGSTSRGITPVQSLKMVKRKFDFLGVGAKKLTDNSDDFAEAVRRCRKRGGHIRLLLSSPKNPALQSVAKQNGRNPQSYSDRVRESIKEILHVKEREGGDQITVKLYDLSSDFSFPHFRLMFTDDRVCILSHVVWNNAEGLDNPQLIIRSKDIEPEDSLYTAYQRYFDDLWNANESKEISSIDDPRLSL